MFHPACSPDGRRVAFQYNHADGRGLWSVAVGGGEEAMLVQDTADTFARPIGWAPDGDWVYYYKTNSWPNWVLRIPARGGEPESLARIPAGTSSIDISRDGHTIGLIERKQTQDLFLVRWPDDSLPSMPGDSLSEPPESER
jgi:Tol biopolymer transport system component